MARVEISRPATLSSKDIEEIAQLIFAAFDDHALMRHEMEWSPDGIIADMGGLWTHSASQGWCLLARRRTAEEGEEGEILGIACCHMPNPTIIPPSRPAEPPDRGRPRENISIADRKEDEEREVSNESERRRAWRRDVQGPFTNSLFDRALGTPRPPVGYLSLIATSPKAQRTGIGRELMEEVWRLGEQQGVGMALMTHMPSNVKWYSSFGYSVNACDELEPLGVEGKVTYWAMSRGQLHVPGLP